MKGDADSILERRHDTPRDRGSESPKTPQGERSVKLSATVKGASPMPKSKFRKKKAPKRVLALPDLEHVKTAVLNTLTSASGQRTYEHSIREFVAW